MLLNLPHCWGRLPKQRSQTNNTWRLRTLPWLVPAQAGSLPDPSVQEDPLVLRLALPPSLQGTHLSLPPWLQCQHQAGITCSRGGPTHFCASIRAAISFHSSAQPVLLSGLQVGQVTPPPTRPRLEPAGSARKTRPNPHALFPLGSTWSCQSLSTHPPGCPVPAGVPTPTLGSWTGREVSINSEGEVCVFGDRGGREWVRGQEVRNQTVAARTWGWGPPGAKPAGESRSAPRVLGENQRPQDG